MKAIHWLTKLLLVFLTVNAYSQFDSTQISYCSQTFIEPRKFGEDTTNRKLQLPLQSGTYIECGKFRLIFEDLIYSTGTGFDDPTLGQTRINCACDVFTYIQTVISIPNNIGTTDPFIDVCFYNDTINIQGNTGILGAASLGLPSAFISSPGSVPPGYYSGYVHQYITTGVKPNPGSVDAMISMNFFYPFRYCNTNSQGGGCDYDFYSVLLHEVTHTMGFTTFTTTDSTWYDASNDRIKSWVNPNVYSLYDDKFLFHYNGSSFDKLVDISSFSGNYGINPVVPNNNPINALTDNSLWLNNSSLTQTRDNIGITSISPYPSGTIGSHIHKGFELNRNHASPGLSGNHVMYPSLSEYENHSTYSNYELRILQDLGYTILPSYIDYQRINNHHPYLTSINGEPDLYTSSSAGLNSYNESQINVNPGLNLGVITSCQNFVLDLSSRNELIDPDGDPIRIYPGSLRNIRGCGQGNNHSQLTVSNGANGDVITFTPKTDFLGLAQFGFYLWDGIEKGSFVVYTIEVTKDANCFIGSANLFINGGFEQGTEIQTTYSPSIPFDLQENTYEFYVPIFPFKQFNYSLHQADGMNILFSTADVIIRNSYVPCEFGMQDWSFPNANRPPSSTGTNGTGQGGDRYIGFINGEQISVMLSENLNPCNQYILDFDFNRHPGFANSANNFLLGTHNGSGNNYTEPVVNNPVAINTSATTPAYSWTHHNSTIQFPNASINDNKIIIKYNSPGYVFVDNLSIVNDPNYVNILVEAGNDVTICQGNSVQIGSSNATPGVTYSWSPAIGLSNPNIASPIATPNSTTTYTLTVTNPYGCSSSDQITITVNPNTNTTINPSSATICYGDVVSLTASGASSFVWSPSVGLSCSTCPNPIASPTATTTYTVTGTNSFGCATNDQINLIVNGIPNISISPTSPTVCAGNSIQLTASGATNYTWSPAAGLSCTNCPNPVASPTSTTTYTVTGTSNGCVGTQNVTVTVNNPIIADAGPDQTTYCNTPVNIGTGAALGASYAWSPTNGLSNPTSATPTANPTITTTYTLTVTNGACVRTDQVTVTVGSGCSATNVLASTYSTTQTLPAGNLAINNNVIIQGAGTIVTMNGNNVSIYTGKTITVKNGATLRIQGSWLHACPSCGGSMWDGIIVENGGTLEINNRSVIEDATTAVKTLATAPGITTPVPLIKIETTLFNKNNNGIYLAPFAGNLTTSYVRNTIFTCRTIASASIYNNATQFTSLYNAFNNTSNNLSSYAVLNTLSNNRSKRGIEVNNCSNILNILTIGSASAGRNVFDTHDFGIYVVDSYLKTINCLFRNAPGNDPIVGQGQPSQLNGVGIHAPDNTTYFSELTVGGTNAGEACTFFNLYRGIDVRFAGRIKVYNSSFNCNATPASFSQLSGTYIGHTAINTKLIIREITLQNNTVYNHLYGSYIQRNALSQNYTPSITVSNNTMGISGSNYLGWAVRLADPTNLTSGNLIRIENNTITQARNGIDISNIKTPLSVSFNTISILNQTGQNRNAINLTTCDLTQVKNNLLSGNNSTNMGFRGINVVSSTNLAVSCNTMTNFGQCMTFEGNCASPYSAANNYTRGVVSNTFVSGGRGLVLTSPSTSIPTGIGIQGDATHPSGNVWQSGFTANHTYTNNVNVNDPNLVPASRFYASNNQPQINSSNLPGGFFSTLYGSIQTATGAVQTCPSGVQNFDGGNQQRSGEELDSLQASTMAEYLQDQLVLDSLGFRDEIVYNHEYFVYQEVSENPLVATFNSAISEFFSTASSTSTGNLFSVDSLLEQGNFWDAYLINDSTTISCGADSLQKQLNQILISYLADPAPGLSTQQLQELETIAGYCHLIFGNAVIQARNLIDGHFNQISEWQESCTSVFRRDLDLGENENALQVQPNPNNGEFSLSFAFEAEGELHICNMQGQTLQRKNIQFISNTYHLDLSTLEKGLYFITFTTSDGQSFVQKVILQ